MGPLSFIPAEVYTPKKRKPKDRRGVCGTGPRLLESIKHSLSPASAYLPACQPAYLDDDDASSPLMNESFQFENFQTNLSKTHKKERQRGRAEEMERLCKLMKFQVCCLSLLFFAWLCVHFHCIFLVNCSWLNYKCMQPSQRPSFKPIQLPI